MMKKIRLKKIISITLIIVLMPGLMSCSGKKERKEYGLRIKDNYRTGYEVFVHSFYDSNGDGIGDLKGLTKKLDYINDGKDKSGDSLGCSEIWTMPIFASPTYHKYDVTDYKSIDKSYGTLDDFDDLVSAVHKRKMTLLLDLPVNHTSNEHPWFKEAAAYISSLKEGENPDPAACKYVDYYNFSREKKTGYEQLPGTIWYYEARFWSGMPDLNLNNQDVRNEIDSIVSFWLDRGCDGFRLDAVTSYFTDDIDSSVSFLKWLTDTVKSHKKAAYLVGECWTDQASYAKYYKSGIDSVFDFDFAGQEGVIASVTNGRRPVEYYIKRMADEEKLYQGYNRNYVNSPFYTNHDMARSAGYYLNDDGSKTKFAEALNLMQTGNAFIYYGEELGMRGSGKDENKRAPMMWSSDQDAVGTCKAPDGMDNIKQKCLPEDKQTKDPDSILSYVRKAIKIRNQYPVIARGQTEVVKKITKGDIGAFTRSMKSGSSKDKDEYESVMIIINAGKKEGTVDLSKVKSMGYTRLDTYLVTNNKESVKKSGDKLSIPAYSMAVLTKPSEE
jgi:glycosidase